MMTVFTKGDANAYTHQEEFRALGDLKTTQDAHKQIKLLGKEGVTYVPVNLGAEVRIKSVTHVSLESITPEKKPAGKRNGKNNKKTNPGE